MSEALLVDNLPGPLERDGVLVAHGGEPVDRLADLARISGAEATQDRAREDAEPDLYLVEP